jgi:thermopsin
MSWPRLSLALALLLLLIALAANAQTVVQPCYCNLSYWNFTFTSPGYIVLASADPHTFNLAVFTARNYDLWWAGNAEPAVYYGSISYGDMVAIPITEPGNYTVVVYPIPNLQYTPQIYATNYSYVGLPIGIASFPRSPIITSEVEGYFKVSAISAYNPNGESQYNVPNSGASLQLNAVVVVELANGQKQYYWAQDVISFITDKDEFHISNNIWNDSGGPDTLSSYAIMGNGKVYSSKYYAYTALSSTYTPPMSGYLIMRAYQVDGSVRIDFGYELGSGGVVWYDHVTITPYEPVVNAYFEAGARLSSDGLPLDAELVFAGYANSEWTNFTSLSAELGLYYWNGSAWLPLPNDYDFGIHAAESAFTDVNVTVRNGLFVLVAPGLFTPGLLYLPQYPVRVVSPIPVLVNGMAATNYTAWLTGGSALEVRDRAVVLGNRTMLVPTVGNETIVVDSPINITVGWLRYYLVEVASPFPVYINGEGTTSYRAWVRSGGLLSIVAYDRVLDNGTRLVPSAANYTYVVNGPIDVAVSWHPEYSVEVYSALPIAVNGVMATNYTAWVRPGSQIVIEARSYVFSNGTMLVPNATSETLRVISPSALSVSWSPRYLVSIRSALPVYVNGVPTRNYTAWATPGSSVRVEAHSYVLDNGTMFTPGVGNETFVVDGPVNFTMDWRPEYLVRILSPLPIAVNGEETTNYTAWLEPGSSVRVEAHSYIYGNGTMFVPGVANVSLIVDAPTALAVSWSPRYLVSVVAAMPIYVNGTLTRSYAAWAAPGSILSIQAPAYGELGGLVVYRPNATDLALTVGGPVSLEVAYSPDYARLAALATAAAAAAALLVLLKGRKLASRAPRRTERLERLHR